MTEHLNSFYLGGRRNGVGQCSHWSRQHHSCWAGRGWEVGVYGKFYSLHNALPFVLRHDSRITWLFCPLSHSHRVTLSSSGGQRSPDLCNTEAPS